MVDSEQTDTVEESCPIVLCVDDETSILRALRRLLMDEECEVEIASSGAEALQLLSEFEIDRVALIFSDQRMPEMTGVEFLQQAKERAPAALRVMLTGYADLDATMAAVNQGQIWRYLTKPWDDKQLILLVRDALKQYHLAKENERLQSVVREQNEELKNWNERLKQRVLEQTDRIRQKSEDLARSNKSLRSSIDHVLESFACMIELRDQSLRHHARNTAAIAEKMAEWSRMTPEEIRQVRVAALLHGVGKLGMDDLILKKNEQDMSDNERKLYEQFPIRSQTALGPIAELQEAGVLIRHLLERFDGEGGPDHLAGDDIPLGSRILAMAEKLDRDMNETSDSLDIVLERMKEDLGSRFDPALIAFLQDAAKSYYSAMDSVLENATRKECGPRMLRPGMMVLRDVYSGTGLLLLKKGVVLNEGNINALKRYYDIDTPEQDVLVLSKDEER